jgi:hypothetical protein
LASAWGADWSIVGREVPIAFRAERAIETTELSNEPKPLIALIEFFTPRLELNFFGHELETRCLLS